MARGYLPLLLLLAALWGASFMFIKVAVDEIEPTAMMFLRLLLSAIPLLALLALRNGVRRAARDLRAVTRDGIFLGGINSALPFVLIAWGEKHVDSGVAAIANASMPIFVTALAIKFRPSERAGGARLLGIVLGLVGVAILAGADPEAGWWQVAGTLAVVAASLSYAVGVLYSQGRLEESASLVLVAASTMWGSLLLLVPGVAQMPRDVPSWEALGSVLALALLGTVAGLLVYFHIIEHYGSTRASLVTYLLPVTALFYGALLLDEPLRATALIGLALILAGVALGSGVLRPARREPVAASP